MQKKQRKDLILLLIVIVMIPMIIFATNPYKGVSYEQSDDYKYKYEHKYSDGDDYKYTNENRYKYSEGSGVVTFIISLLLVIIVYVERSLQIIADHPFLASVIVIIGLSVITPWIIYLQHKKI